MALKIGEAFTSGELTGEIVSISADRSRLGLRLIGGKVIEVSSGELPTKYSPEPAKPKQDEPDKEAEQKSDKEKDPDPVPPVKSSRAPAPAAGEKGKKAGKKS